VRPLTFRLAAASLAGAATLLVAGQGSAVLPERADLPAPAAARLPSPGDLRIMLTNDDGWAAPGITIVFDALVAAGYDVTMVAPLSNNSGMGGRITLGGTLAVTQPEPRKYAVDGTPSDAAELGINTVFAADPPDLVVSGTNKGQNLASLQIHSGTVAAAATALNDGIPAIAISTGWDYADPQADPASFPYDYTAAYLLQLLDRLRATARPDGSLLPDGVGLNVNYPYVNGGQDRARGVKVLDSGSGYADLAYAGATLPAVGGSSTYTVGADLFDSVERDADDVWFRRGYVTITPITGNYDAELSVGSAERLRTRLD
jgi:5'/3'-nucleotidase SurE